MSRVRLVSGCFAYVFVCSRAEEAAAGSDCKVSKIYGVAGMIRLLAGESNCQHLPAPKQLKKLPPELNPSLKCVQKARFVHILLVAKLPFFRFFVPNFEQPGQLSHQSSNGQKQVEGINSKVCLKRARHV